MNIKTTLSHSAFALLILSSTHAFAHGRFIVPTHTILSGDSSQSISLISSISNDVFHPDVPLGDNGKGISHPALQGMFKQLNATVTKPDAKIEQLSWQAQSRQSVADYTLSEQGTYRFSIVQAPTPMTTFKMPDGTPNRAFGKHPKLPKGATDITHRMVSSRVESFVSHNEPNLAALRPVGKGIEIGGETHPNDLFSNEPASFQLFLHGKPLQQSIEVHLTQSGTRHRNQRNEIIAKTNTNGEFEVNFKQAGLYLLEAEMELAGDPGTDVAFHHHSLYVTLEVFPE